MRLLLKTKGPMVENFTPVFWDTFLGPILFNFPHKQKKTPKNNQNYSLIG